MRDSDFFAQFPPKKAYKMIDEKILRLIATHPDGASTKELFDSLGGEISKRSLQYRLARLVKAGVLKMEGSGRSSRYLLVAEASQESPIIPLSIEGQKLSEQVSAPIQLRQHVSYQREFLESYQPNRTFYLPESALEKLAKLGGGVERGRPAGTYAKRIYQRLLIDLSWNSSRLEGNTYSLLETERLLERGEEAPGSSRIDSQMILNHKDAIEYIVEMAQEININSQTVLNIHALLSNELLLDPKACGRLRTAPVKIAQSVYYPIEVPQLVHDYFQLILEKGAAINNPFEQSFFLMVHLPYLQPFLDVNKRVSRLVGNIPFIRNNLTPLSFVDLPEKSYIEGLLAVYELNRIELFRDLFIWAYERSAPLYLAVLESIGEPDPFRLRYRDLIRDAVYQVVHRRMSSDEASQFVSKLAHEQIASEEDRSRFLGIVESEIQNLHEGNIARFKIRPSDFAAWRAANPSASP